MRQLRILLADDDPAVHVSLQHLARGLDHQLDAVEDGKACLSKLKQHVYDLLFLDLIMPVVDGTQVLAYARENHPAMRVVMISTLDEPLTIDSLLKSGASAYLIKPLRESMLTEVLSRIASGTISQDLTPKTAGSSLDI